MHGPILLNLRLAALIPCKKNLRGADKVPSLRTISAKDRQKTETFFGEFNPTSVSQSDVCSLHESPSQYVRG